MNKKPIKSVLQVDDKKKNNLCGIYILFGKLRRIENSERISNK